MGTVPPHRSDDMPERIDRTTQFARYLAREIGPESMPGEASVIPDVTTIVEALAPVTEPQVDQAWARAQKQLHPTRPKRHSSSLSRGLRIPGTSRLGRSMHGRSVHGRSMFGSLLAAAAIAVLAVVGFSVASRYTEGRVSEHRYVAAVAHPMTVSLPDGSTAILAPQSVLRVPSDFGTTTRVVQLQGEAYFNVPVAEGIPFLVQSGRITTRVLGTQFSVSEREMSPTSPVEIIVTHGRVSAQTPRGVVTVGSGYVADITDSATVVTTSNALHAYTDWSHDRIVFEDASVPAMLGILGRWYGYTFALTDSSLARQHVSVTFKTTDRQEMMMLLREILDVSITVDGSHVILAPRHGESHGADVRQTLKLPQMERGR